MNEPGIGQFDQRPKTLAQRLITPRNIIILIGAGAWIAVVFLFVVPQIQHPSTVATPRNPLVVDQGTTRWSDCVQEGSTLTCYTKVR